MFKTILTSLCLMPTLSYAWIALGNVMGRDLDVPGMGWIGHVGIVYAESYIPPDKVSTQGRVIEVLNENQVIQINTFQSFKSKSNYWGNGSGVANNSTDNIMKILKEANTQRGFCPIYTTTALYQPGTPNSCAVFRCDTFVYHIYYSVGYKLIKDGGVMLPESIFKAFPFHYSEYSINTNKLNIQSKDALYHSTSSSSKKNPLSYFFLLSG